MNGALEFPIQAKLVMISEPLLESVLLSSESSYVTQFLISEEFQSLRFPKIRCFFPDLMIQILLHQPLRQFGYAKKQSVVQGLKIAVETTPISIIGMQKERSRLTTDLR